jgi:hypothetical protein
MPNVVFCDVVHNTDEFEPTTICPMLSLSHEKSCDWATWLISRGEKSENEEEGG